MKKITATGVSRTAKLAPMKNFLMSVSRVKPEEIRATLWSFTYFFCLLSSYYVLRPVRDEMGIQAGLENLPSLFTATFIVMLCAAPVYGWLVGRLPRRIFVPLVYRFFIATMIIFWAALSFDWGSSILASAIFVWVSVFNLFVVSVFWSVMADLFNSEQGKRLFGFIAAGGSAGVILGPSLTLSLAPSLGAANLLLVSAVILEAGIFAMRRAVKTTPDPEQAAPSEQSSSEPEAIGGSAIDGLKLIAGSRYLAGIALWVFILSLAGTFLYFEQQHLVKAASSDSGTRLQIFAGIDLAAGILTILIQLFLTGRLVEKFGTGIALAFLPVIFIAGFAVLAIAPTIAAVILFQAIQRSANFAISNPAREMLFTVVARNAKFKAKNVIDTALFRGADVANSWLFSLLQTIGLEIAAIAGVAIPVMAGWAGLSGWLGKRHRQKSEDVTATP